MTGSILSSIIIFMLAGVQPFMVSSLMAILLTRSARIRSDPELYILEAVTDDNRLAHFCGKQIDPRNGSSIRYYELVKMPDGANVH
jgi:hypothetical protein